MDKNFPPQEDPFDQNLHEKLLQIATGLDQVLNGPDCPPEKREVAFMVLVFPNKPKNEKDLRVNFMSNTKRERVLKVLQEFMERHNKKAEWN